MVFIKIFTVLLIDSTSHFWSCWLFIT